MHVCVYIYIYICNVCIIVCGTSCSYVMVCCVFFSSSLPVRRVQGSSERTSCTRLSNILAGALKPPFTLNSHRKIQVFSDATLGKFCAAVKLPIKKRFLGNPTLGQDFVRKNIVKGTGSSFRAGATTTSTTTMRTTTRTTPT